MGLIPGLGGSPREGKGYLLQYSGLENSMDCIGIGVAMSQTRLSDFPFHHHFNLWVNVKKKILLFSLPYLPILSNKDS